MKYVLQRMYGALGNESNFYDKLLSTETEAEI